MRTTVNQVMLSRIPQVVGLCQNDIPGVLSFVNEAQQRLINAAGDVGWYGTWARVVFQITSCNPYITLPRQYARAIQLAYCRHGVRIQNPFFEELEASIGLQDFNHCRDWCGAAQGFDRGNFPTMADVSPANQYLAVYATDPRDAGSRVLIGPCQDQNGNFIYTQDGANPVNGFYITLTAPPNPSIGMINGFPVIVTNIQGVQKDATFGAVQLFQQDATSSAQVLLSQYAPDEITPSYRRYFLKNPPCGCTSVPPQSPCITPQPIPTTTQITAMCKLEFIPANLATDFLIIGNIPALKEECMAIRYGEMDSGNAPPKEGTHHAAAVRLLNQELAHYLGSNSFAVNYAPFGVARLSHRMRAVRHG